LLDVQFACLARFECIDDNIKGVKDQLHNLGSMKAHVNRIQEALDQVKAWLNIGQAILDKNDVMAEVISNKD
jgi:hypothetical protein